MSVSKPNMGEFVVYSLEVYSLQFLGLYQLSTYVVIKLGFGNKGKSNF